MLDAACNGKRSIFLGALRDSTSEEDLEQYFSGFGRVVRACKCTDPETGELRRFGFVDFSEYGVVRKVMNITKHYIKVRFCCSFEVNLIENIYCRVKESK